MKSFRGFSLALSSGDSSFGGTGDSLVPTSKKAAAGLPGLLVREKALNPLGRSFIIETGAMVLGESKELVTLALETMAGLDVESG